MARNTRKQKNIIRLDDARTEVEKTRKRKVEIIPKNLVQEEYIEYLNDERKKIVFAIGPAGTGKTYLAVLKAIKMLKEGEIEKIILTRPAVSVDEKHGFLPGDLNAKMDPWVRPIMDVFEEYYSPASIKKMIEENIIEICPLAYMRGRNFKNALVILDESQNCTDNQMKMALTRIAIGTRMIVTGDVNQTDVQTRNGLRDILQKMKASPQEGMAHVVFTREHVEREEVVKQVLSLYGEE